MAKTHKKVEDTIMELRGQGRPFVEIADTLSITRQKAVDIANEKLEEIETLDAIEMEAVFENKQVNRRGRINQLAALQTKLREEIDRRSLEDVPTDKLISLFIKTSDALKDEVYIPKIHSTDEQEKARSDRHAWWL